MNQSTYAHTLVMIDLSGTSLSPDERELLKNYRIGGICMFRRNFRDRYHMAEFSSELRELCGPDLLIATDQEGGTVVRALDVPYSIGNMALGSIADPALSRKLASLSARGLRAMGININFAPVADVNNNPKNPVIGDRSFGDQASKVAEHVVAFVQGLQAEGVAATLKHFPGHGDTATDSHHDLPRLEASLARLQAVELLPFKAGIAAGSACVMSYHGMIRALDPEHPGSLSKKVMTDFLRNELGFDGVCFSDALEMQAIAQRYGAEEAVIRALEAGIDMPLYDLHCKPVALHEAIFKAVDSAQKSDRLDPEAIKRSLERLRRLAKRYPARPNPETAWQEGDETLLAQSAAKAVTTVGHVPSFSQGSKLILIAADSKVGGSASDLSLTPAHALAERCAEMGFELEKRFYQPEALSYDSLLENLSAPVIFISASRTRLDSKEVSLAQLLAQKSPSFMHIALWNPYSVQDIAKPAVVSFGFSPGALEQVVAVLSGSPAVGRLPFSL